MNIIGGTYAGTTQQSVIEKYDNVPAITAFLPLELNQGALQQFKLNEVKFQSLFWHEFKDLLLNHGNLKKLCYPNNIIYFGAVSIE